MRLHANAKLGLGGRKALVVEVLGGSSLKAAAAAFNVAPGTAHRWWHRWLDADHAERDSGAWAFDRSSVPHRQPRRLSAAEERPILDARRRTNLGPGRLAGLVRRARSTIWKVLWRHGLSRLRRSGERQTFKRYEWAEPGALLHQDTKHLANFDSPGHWAHGDRSEQIKTRRAGYTYAHCVVDDHTRLAYVELHPADSAAAAAGTLERAIAWFADQGCRPPEAVMTDNALIYTRSRAYRQALQDAGARHITTPFYTPRWNGKVERFIQTLDREWAHAHSWPSSHDRNRSLTSFLRYYNRRRPHSSIGDRPPINRVHNLRGQDT